MTRPGAVVDGVIYVFTDASGEDGDGIPLLDWAEAYQFVGLVEED